MWRVGNVEVVVVGEFFLASGDGRAEMGSVARIYGKWGRASGDVPYRLCLGTFDSLKDV